MVVVARTKRKIHKGKNIAIITLVVSDIIDVSDTLFNYNGCEQRVVIYVDESSELYELEKGDSAFGVTLRVHRPTMKNPNRAFIDFIPGEPTEDEIRFKLKKKEEIVVEDDVPLNCLITKKVEIMDLGFLENLALNTVEPKTRTTVELPTGRAIRVYKTGKTYPSEELAKQFALEYTAKTAEAKGFGMDIMKSTDFPMIPAGTPNFMLCAFVPRGEGKIDLFKGCKYKDDSDEAPVSVLKQGAATFGKAMLSMIAETYGVEPKDNYIDLVIIDKKQVSPNGIYIIPKTVSTGANKGSLTYITRNNVDVFPIIVDDSTAVPVGTNAMEATAPDIVQKEPAQAPETPTVEPAPVVEPVQDTMPAGTIPPAPVVEAAPVAAPPSPLV